MKKISTLNVKSGRSDKCENKFYAKCEKRLVSWMTSQMVSLDNLVSRVNFVRHFRISGCQHSKKLKFLGSVMILRENVKFGSKSGQVGIFLGFYM